MIDKTFDRKDITAVEARGLIAGVNWDYFVNNKIKECNEQIRKYAKYGYHETRVELWSREQYVWDKVMQHFQNNGFEVRREWRAIIKW